MLKLFSQYRGLRKEIYILFIGRIVTNLGSMVWPVLTLILNAKLGLDATKVAVVSILAGLCQLPFGLLGGKFADKYNKKNIIVICDIISIFFYILCGIVPLTLWSIVLLLIGSTFQSIEGPSYDALMADLAPTKDREKAYSLQYLGMNIGLVASPTIAGLLFKNYLWLSFIISGVAIGVSTILIFFFIKDITPTYDPDKSSYQNAKEGANIFTVMKENKLIVFFIIFMALYSGAYNQYGFLMPINLAAIHGEGSGALIYGSISSLNCIVVVIFTPILTKLFSKVWSTGKNLIGEMLVAVGYGVFLIFLGHIPAYYLAIVLFTWGEIMEAIVFGPYISSRIPESHRGRFNGVSTVLNTLIINVVMLLSGMVYDNFGSTSAWVFVLSVLGVAIFCGIILVFADRKVYRELY
ncbi:MAG: MFS transporter [Acetatifactor sp.]|nr:MFS transporter [Acetatifactor sp.]